MVVTPGGKTRTRRRAKQKPPKDVQDEGADLAETPEQPPAPPVEEQYRRVPDEEVYVVDLRRDGRFAVTNMRTHRQELLPAEKN